MDNRPEVLDASALVLEAMIDKHGLAYVVELLARVCDEKAEHIDTNWQDKKLAGDWHHDGEKLTRVAGRLCNQS